MSRFCIVFMLQFSFCVSFSFPERGNTLRKWRSLTFPFRSVPSLPSFGIWAGEKCVYCAKNGNSRWIYCARRIGYTSAIVTAASFIRQKKKKTMPDNTRAVVQTCRKRLRILCNRERNRSDLRCVVILHLLKCGHSLHCTALQVAILW